MKRFNPFSILLLLCFMNCYSQNKIDIQGHRGCRGLLPENTIQAIEKAIEIGVHTLELDLAVSKDNVVVVSHEPYMSRKICLDENGKDIPRSMDKQYNLYQMTFEKIKQFDCGTKYHPKFPNQKKIKAYKPSLDKVIKSAKAKNPEIKFNIELKASPMYDGIYTPHPKEFVKLVLDVINKNEVFVESNLQSFDVRILEEIKKQSPKMRVALLVDYDESISKKLNSMSYAPEIISPYFRILSKEKVRKYQKEGYQIIPWTVNQEKHLLRLIKYNVDGIITDYPDRLVNLLKN